MLLLLMTSCSSASAPAHPEAKTKQETVKPFTIHTESTQLAGGSEKNTRQPKPLTLAELHAKYKTAFLFQGPASPKQVALTFDDVPDNHYTPQVLDILKKYHVKATFFVMGSRAKAYPEMVKRMVKEGHVVGNHSYTHPDFPKLTDAAFRQEVTRTNQVIYNLTKKKPLLIRPPYGNINEAQIKWLLAQHMKIINWNIDSLDWTGLAKDQVKHNILSNLTSGSIILQHAAGGEGENLSGSVQALPEIIQELRAKHIDMVTVPELLKIPAYK